MNLSKHTYLFIPANVVVTVLLLLTGCSQEPKPIHLHSDECAHCKMMITDPRFAAQIVNAQGKAVKFDAIECMTQYYANNEGRLSDARLWVSDFNNPGTWVEAGEAIYIKSEVIKSPMGESLLALPSKEAAEKHLMEYPGRPMTWEELSSLKPVSSHDVNQKLK